MMMALQRHLKNEAGIAALIMVIAALIIVSLVGINFVIEQENKHQGAAVTVNAEQAQANAEAGWRYAQKCLTGSDPSCPCNTGAPNDCLNWIGMVNFPVIPFGGSGGSFQVSFPNVGVDPANCAIEITSTGIANNTQRTINDIFTRNNIGAADVVAVDNSQSFLGPVVPPIAVLNQQTASATSGGSSITFNNYNVPAGSDLVLVVMAGSEANSNNALPSGVTFGGNAMTLADRGVSFGGGSDPGVGLFYLPVTAGSSGNVVATFQGNTDNRVLGIVTLSNAVAPPEAVELVTTSGTQITDNITTLSTNAMIISAAYFKDDENLIPQGTGHTEITGNDIPNNEAEGAMGYRQAGAPGTVTGTGYGAQGGGSDNMVQVLAAFPHANRTISMNYTVPAGSSPVLVVVAGAEDGNSPVTSGSTLPISATFNGNAMNLVTNNNVSTSGFEAGVGMFWLDVSAGDAGTITVTYNDSSIDNKTLHAYTLTGATGPPESVETTTGTNAGSLTDNFNVVLTAGSIVVSGGYQGNGNAFVAQPNPGTHVINSQVAASSSQGVMGSLPVPIATAPAGIGFSTSPNFNRMAMILASFAPNGGGPCL